MGRSANKMTNGMTDEEFANAYSNEGPTNLGKRLSVLPNILSVRAAALRKKGYTINTPPNYLTNNKDNYGKIAEISNQQLKSDIEKLGYSNTARMYKVNTATLFNNAKRRGLDAKSPIKTCNKINEFTRNHPQRYEIEVENGTVIIFSDAHYWPGKASVAHRALVKMVHEKTPAAIICNGDAVDMAAASRHPPIGWETRPSIQDEIETAQERLGEILAACTKRTRKAWNLGNHDARFETRLAAVAPEYAKVAGIHLHDHFPEWERAWSTWINNDVVVKHRWKGGDHATWNNTIKSGKTTITGHLHSAHVRPFSDYNGTRFGVDTGCLADTYGPQFANYTEDNPRNWVSGFGILTFRKGQLLWPELVVAWDKDHVQYRGEIIHV